MTNEEAIDILRNAAWLGTNTNREQTGEAVEMAINALTKEAWKEEHPVSPLLNLQPSKQDDLIERARAIEIIHESQDSQTFGQTADNAYDLVEWAISEIPSVQPVLTCKGCKYDGYYKQHVQCRNCLRKERDLYEPE